MEEKNTIKISLSTFLLILSIIVIIAMGYFIYNFFIENKQAKVIIEEQNNTISELKNKITNLQSTINSISNTIQESNSSYEQIILDGSYGEDGTDEIFIFTKDGKAEIGYSLSSKEGTYTTISENEIRVTLVKNTICDIDTGNKTIEEINETFILSYIDEDTLKIKNEDGTSFLIFKIK